MKTFKIILGFLLLYGAANAYSNSGFETGTFFYPPAIFTVLLFLFFGAWLIGSGFSKQKFKLKSFAFLKFFIISFVSFMFFAVISIASHKTPEVYVEYNGIKISVGKCIEGSRRIIPDKEERKDYCSCIAEKLANSDEIKEKYIEELENGKFDNILFEIKREDYFENLKIEDCTKSVEIKWSDGLANGMKMDMMQELSGTEFENTNDIEEYCDCVIKEYRKLPLKEINKEDFHKSIKAISIDRICTEETKK